MERRRIATVFCLAALVGCATTGTYSPEIVRLQDDLARVASDDRIASHAPRELGAARRAVDRLVADGRKLDDAEFDHRIYVADRLVAIAAAEGLARDAEERAELLSTERESLLIDARTRQAVRARADADARYAVEEAEEEAADEAE